VQLRQSEIFILLKQNPQCALASGILKIDDINGKAFLLPSIANGTQDSHERRDQSLLSKYRALYAFTDKNTRSQISAVFSHHKNQLPFAVMTLI